MTGNPSFLRRIAAILLLAISLETIPAALAGIPHPASRQNISVNTSAYPTDHIDHTDNIDQTRRGERPFAPTGNPVLNRALNRLTAIFTPVIPVLYANGNAGKPSGPEAKVEGMNMSAFGSVRAGAVDASTGTFSLERTDVEIPGRNGMNLTIKRTYDSKTFASSARWSALDGDAYKNYANADLKTLEWKGATPEQYGGWIGQGWRLNTGGRLLHMRISASYRHADWFGANTITHDRMSTDLVVIQTGTGSYSFEKRFKQTKHGIEDNDSMFFPVDKGSRAALVQLEGGGFELILENGYRMAFKEQYYDTSFELHYYTETDLRSVHKERHVQNRIIGAYISAEEDSLGNRLTYEYEKGDPYVFEPQHESLDQNPFDNLVHLPMNTVIHTIAESTVTEQGERPATQKEIDDQLATMPGYHAYQYFQLVTHTGWPKAQAISMAAWGMDKAMTKGLGIDLEKDIPGFSSTRFHATMINAVVTAIEMDAPLGEIMASALQHYIINQIKEAVINTVVDSLLAAIPGPGWVLMALKYAIKELLNILLADVAYGSIDTATTITPIRPVRIYDDAGNEIVLKYRTPHLPVPESRMVEQELWDKEQVFFYELDENGRITKKGRTYTLQDRYMEDFRKWKDRFRHQSDTAKRLDKSNGYATCKYKDNVREEYDFKGEAENYSQIAEIEYTGPNGREIIKYDYDDNGLLIKVTKPGNETETYGYTHYTGRDKEGKKLAGAVDKSLDGKLGKNDGVKALAGAMNPDLATAADYNLDGYLLSSLTTPTGLTLKVEYAFIHAKERMPYLTDDEDARLSSYVVTKRTVSGRGMDAGAGTILTQTWGYEGYDKASLYGTHQRSKDPVQPILYFPHITITTPRGEQVHDFSDGLPKKSINEAGHVTFSDWLYDIRRPKRQVLMKGSFQSVTDYLQYDDFGFPLAIKQSGTITPARIQKKEYVRDEAYLKKNNLVHIKREWIEDDTGKKYMDTENIFDSQGKGLKQSSTVYGGDVPMRTRFSYDEFGNLTKTIDPLGFSTEVIYANGIYPVQTKKDISKGKTVTTQTSYYPHSLRVKDSTNENGITTAYRYDDRGRITEETVTYPNGGWKKTTSRYDDDPARLQITMGVRTRDGALDQTLIGKFNAFSKLYESHMIPDKSPAEPFITRYRYSDTLDIVSVTDPMGRMTSYEYDSLGRITRIVTPDGTETKTDYADSTNTTLATDENGNVTHYTFDAFDRLLQVRLANRTTAEYHYNPLDQLIRTRDMKGVTIEYSTNGAGQLTTITQAKGAKESKTYDANGNVLTFTDRNGNTTTWSGYDSQGRPKTVTYSDGTVTTFEYDKDFIGTLSAVNLTSKTGEKQTSQYTHDAYGQRIAEQHHLNGFQYNLTYKKNDTGQTLTQTDSLSGRTLGYRFDGLGRLTDILLTTDGNLTEVVKDIRYSKANEMLSYAIPPMTETMAFTYDKRSRQLSRTVTDDTGKTVFKQTYAYDPAGNRIKTDSVHPDEKKPVYEQSFEYDDTHRLIARHYKNTWEKYPKEGSYHYRFDRNGNQMERTYPSNGKMIIDTDYTTNQPLKRRDLNSYGMELPRFFTYAHDQNGNRTEQLRWVKQTPTAQAFVAGKMTYVWNSRNQMAEVWQNSDKIQENRYHAATGLRYLKKELGASNEALRLRYAYRYADDKTATPETQLTTYFIYNEHGKLIAEKQDETGKVFYYIPFGNEIMARVHTDPDTGKDRWLWMHNDPVGTPALMEEMMPVSRLKMPETYTIQKGQETIRIFNAFHTDPWGIVEWSLIDQRHVDRFLMIFTGKKIDYSTGFAYFNARFYDPLLPVFLNPDPAIAEQGQPYLVENVRHLNPFLYAYSNPLRYTDPTGKSSFSFQGMLEWSFHDLVGISPEEADFKVKENSLEARKQRNYNRNLFNKNMGDFNRAFHEGWTIEPDYKAVYHQQGIGGKANVKMMSPDGHFENVFNSSGEQVFNPRNIGTYNFGTTKYDHVMEDVIPYIFWGNAKDDPSTVKDRLWLSLKGLKMQLENARKAGK